VPADANLVLARDAAPRGRFSFHIEARAE